MTDKYSAEQLHNLSDARLEELISGLSPETEPEYWLAVMEEYSRRESAPTPGAEAGSSPCSATPKIWTCPGPWSTAGFQKRCALFS